MKRVIAFHLSCIMVLIGLNAAGQAIDEAKTRQVFKHHDEAFGAKDIKAVLDDYTEESMLITPDGTYTGLQQLKGFFEEAFKLFPKDSVEGNTIKEVISKDVVFTVWNVKTPRLNLAYAAETFIIQNGKITRQTFAGYKKE